MITKLTKNQEARFPEFVEKWVRIGLRTEPLDHKETQAAYTAFQKDILKRDPAPVVILDGPIHAWMAVRIVAQAKDQVRDQVWDQVWAQVGEQVVAQVGEQVVAQVGDQVWAQVLSQVGAQVEEQVRDQVGAQVGAQVGEQVVAQVGDQVRAQVAEKVWAQVGPQVRDQVWDQVRAQVGDQVRAQVAEKVWAQVGPQVRDQVWDQVWAQVGPQVRAQVGDQLGEQIIWPYWDGQFWANFFAFYDFCEEVLGLSFSDNYKIARSCCVGIAWPLRNLCVISDAPSIIKLTNGRLHSEYGPAVAYRDGTKVFALNGIRMSEAHVMTPAEQLTPQSVLAETNADIRRELIRKVGVERMLDKLPHKRLGKSGNYELLSVRLSEQVSDARYLKMLNPSVGVWHVEGVAPECGTVAEALNWRNQQWHETAELLT